MQNRSYATFRHLRPFSAYDLCPSRLGAFVRSRAFSQRWGNGKSKQCSLALMAFFFGLQDELVLLAARHAVPTVFPLSDYVAAGGLISYGANLSESWRQTGVYVGKIARGMKTTDLPIEQSAKFKLVINLKTAKALRLEV